MNMKFFSSQTIANTNTQIVNRNFYMPMKQVVQPQTQQVVNTPIVEIQTTQENTPKKVKLGQPTWGEPTWFLLHTLSIKVKGLFIKSTILS